VAQLHSMAAAPRYALPFTSVHATATQHPLVCCARRWLVRARALTRKASILRTCVDDCIALPFRNVALVHHKLGRLGQFVSELRHFHRFFATGPQCYQHGDDDQPSDWNPTLRATCPMQIPTHADGSRGTMTCPCWTRLQRRRFVRDGVWAVSTDAAGG
jgi:hypothetical protein